MVIRNEVRTITSHDVLVDEVRETPVDRQLSHTRRWVLLAFLLIVIVAVAVETSI